MSGRTCICFYSMAFIIVLAACAADLDGEPAEGELSAASTAVNSQALSEDESEESTATGETVEPMDGAPPRPLSGRGPIVPDPEDQARADAAVAAVQAEIDQIEGIRGTLTDEEFLASVDEARCRHYGCPEPPESRDLPGLERQAAALAAFQREVDVLRRDRHLYTDLEWEDLVGEVYYAHFDCDTDDPEVTP